MKKIPKIPSMLLAIIIQFPVPFLVFTFIPTTRLVEGTPTLISFLISLVLLSITPFLGGALYNYFSKDTNYLFGGLVAVLYLIISNTIYRRGPDPEVGFLDNYLTYILSFFIGILGAWLCNKIFNRKNLES